MADLGTVISRKRRQAAEKAPSNDGEAAAPMLENLLSSIHKPIEGMVDQTSAENLGLDLLLVEFLSMISRKLLL